MEEKESKKEIKFFWGAATSAHQVEGGNKNDWTEFEREKGLEQSGLACDHYNRFREDFDIALSLGHNAHRLSIEWSRVEPREGEFDEVAMEHYRDVIAALRERGLEPFVTLWHWTIPIWFRNRGGWVWRGAPDAFTRFAERMARALPEVRFWITLNEPDVYTTNGYLKGIWPPGIRSLRGFFRANKNLIEAHRKSFIAIKNLNPSAEIGIAQNVAYFEAARGSLVNRAIKNFLEYYGPRYVLDRISDFQDFVGVNYYSRNWIDWGLYKNENKSVSDMGWEIYPEGMYYVLKSTAKRYSKPIYVLENGIADAKDEKRAKFIREHIEVMQRAMREGVDVRGYFYWSLLDNFEWAHGFKPRFGLVEVDYKTMARKVRNSAYEYRRLISQK